MADKADVDAPGVEEPASSPASESTVDGSAAELSELVKKVIADELKPIKGEISGLYSRQDKDRNTLSEFMDEFKKLKADGLTDDAAHVAAERTIKTREQSNKQAEVINALAEKFLDEPSTQPAGSGASGTIEAADAIEMLKDYKNLSANSPKFLELLRVGATKASVEQFILDETKTSPPASVSGMVVSPAVAGASSGSLSENDIDKLAVEKMELFKKIPSETTQARIEAIDKQFVEAGIPLD